MLRMKLGQVDGQKMSGGVAIYFLYLRYIKQNQRVEKGY